MKAVANTGPLIHLSWINRLDLLRALFDEVLVPGAVRREVFDADEAVRGIAAFTYCFAETWLTVVPVVNSAEVARLSAVLDPGEAAAMVLFEQAGASILLLDERRARALAVSRGIPVTRTVGILRRAHTRGLIPAVSPILHQLRQMGSWLNTSLIEQMEQAERTDRPQE